MTFFEFEKRFPTEEAALGYLIEKRYPKKQYVCPHYGVVGNKVYHLESPPRKFVCKSCGRVFFVLAGTIFGGTQMEIRWWLFAILFMLNSPKGVSATELQGWIGMKTYVSVLKMLKKIREVMGKESYKETFKGIVEVDETYIGGKPRKRNDCTQPIPPEEQPKRGRGTPKIAVAGVLERKTGRVYMRVMKKRVEDGKRLTGRQLLAVLNHVCQPNTKVMTDQYAGYNILSKPSNKKNLVRYEINHKKNFSRSRGIHTNGMESIWATLKRGLHGVYHHVSDEDLQSYLNEFCFRLSHRSCDKAFERLIELAMHP